MVLLALPAAAVILVLTCLLPLFASAEALALPPGAAGVSSAVKLLAIPPENIPVPPELPPKRLLTL